ncbi:MAG: dipeptide/oligopeptide/nickel ABC transporter ATP-binding protein [Pseudomonadota bacterium]
MTHSPPLLVLERLQVDVAAAFGRRTTLIAETSLQVRAGEIVAVVGPSGSGKSTLLKAILGLVPFTNGSMAFRGEPIRHSLDRTHRRLRAAAEAVFQNPLGALNPHRSLRHTIEEPLLARGMGQVHRRQRVDDVARHMGLASDVLERRPAAVSLGQAQRACIARALAPHPSLLFLDEPLSALDAVVALDVAKLLVATIHEARPTVLLISHDLRLVRRLATRVLVVDAGRIVEDAATERFLASPTSTAGRALVASDARRRAVLEACARSVAQPLEISG